MTKPITLSLLLITSLTLLAYSPLIPYLGFYSEDFFFSYVAHFYGKEGAIQSLSIDRPFNGYLLAFNYFILGLKDNVFLWHIYMLLIKLLGGYALFFTLLKLWPKKIATITIITLLFLLYPGFLQQTLPLGYNVHITGLTVWVLSLLFTTLAVKSKSKMKTFFYTFIAIILQILTFLNLEFFIGMEVLRFLIIFYILNAKSFKTWTPYILSTFVFIFWRIFIFKSSRPETDINIVTQTYYSNPIWLLQIPIEMAHSFLQTLVGAFILPLAINFIRLPLTYSVIAILVGIIPAILIYFYFKNISDKEDHVLGKKLFFIGLVSIVGALIPIILSGRIVRIYAVYDRYTITSIVAVGFIIVGICVFKFKDSLGKWILLLLISLSVTSHIMNGFWHKVMWERQKDLWWQLYFRAPQIKENTMLILDFPEESREVPFKNIINKVKWNRFYWAEEQIWTAGNLFFNYNNPPKSHFYGDFLEDEGILDKIEKKVVENVENRGIKYTRDFGNALIITTPSSSSCLHIQSLNTDRLIKAGPQVIPPREIFGNEPRMVKC